MRADGKGRKEPGGVYIAQIERCVAQRGRSSTHAVCETAFNVKGRSRGAGALQADLQGGDEGDP